MRYDVRRSGCGHCAVAVICMGKHRDFECSDRTGASGAYQSGSSYSGPGRVISHLDSTRPVPMHFTSISASSKLQKLREGYREPIVLAVSYLAEI